MAHAWHRHGTGMVQAWYKHGTGMAQAWYWHGTGMVQAWYRYGTGFMLVVLSVPRSSRVVGAVRCTKTGCVTNATVMAPMLQALAGGTFAQFVMDYRASSVYAGPGAKGDSPTLPP